MQRSLVIIFFLISLSLNAQLVKQKEAYYQNMFAQEIKGQTEVVLNDRARVDIVTQEYAIEVDFAPKWAESIGQSLYYGIMLHKKPGVVLIVDGNKEQRYINRLLYTAENYYITVWILDYRTNKYKLLTKF